jgi:hypothetical protein
MLIRAVATGRKTFGDKVDPATRKSTIEGVPVVISEYDTWSSGEHAGDGQYVRVTNIETAQVVDPWPNIKMPLLRLLRDLPCLATAMAIEDE